MEPNYCKNKSLNNRTLKEIAEFLKIISEENRLKVVCMLCPGEKCVCEIWQRLNLPQNLVSHHLKVLKDSRLISSRKEGQKVFYSLNSKFIKKYTDLLNKFLNLEKNQNQTNDKY